MIFTCKANETTATLTDRVTLEAEDNDIVVTLDTHRGLIQIQELDEIELRFDDSLEYSCNATLIASDNKAFIASSGGLLFSWTGTLPVEFPAPGAKQFKYSIGRCTARKTVHDKPVPRRSKRVKAT